VDFIGAYNNGNLFLGEIGVMELAKVFIKNNWAEPVQKDKPEVKK